MLYVKCPSCGKDKPTPDKLGSFSLVLTIPNFGKQSETIQKPYKTYMFKTDGICKDCAEIISGDDKIALEYSDKEKEYILKIIEKMLNSKTIRKIK